MKSFVQTTTSSTHAILLFILALAYTGYEAAYPYLNPQNLQWQNAVIYGSMAIISALVLGHGVASAHNRLGTVEDRVGLGGRGTDTASMPAAQFKPPYGPREDTPGAS